MPKGRSHDQRGENENKEARKNKEARRIRKQVLEQTTSDVEVWRTIRSLDGRQPPAKKNEALVVKGKAYISDADKQSSSRRPTSHFPEYL